MRNHSLREDVEAALTEFYGLKPPAALSVFLAAVLDELTTRPGSTFAEESYSNYLAPACWLDAAVFKGGTHRSNTPGLAEFLPFASSNVDGVEYGLLVHAPELELEDHPVVEFGPREAEQSLQLVGLDCRAGLQRLLCRAQWLVEAGLDARWLPILGANHGRVLTQRIEKLSTELGCSLDTSDITSPVYEAAGEVEPDVPDGWRYVASSDGVGVLAPANAFAPQEAPVDDAGLTKVLSLCEAALAEDHPATALLLGREALHQRKDDPDEVAPLEELMCRALRALHRPMLARALQTPGR